MCFFNSCKQKLTKLGSTFWNSLFSFSIHYCSWFPKYMKSCFSNKCMHFTGGSLLGYLYYSYLLKEIPFPRYMNITLGIIIFFGFGIGNVVCKQLRCVSLLMLPMYCGKPGRGVLKVLALTYVVAGPITNMACNAKEVVRVFACSNELGFNLSSAKYGLVAEPFRQAVLGLGDEIEDIKETMRSISTVIAPLQREMEDVAELAKGSAGFDLNGHVFGNQTDNVFSKYKTTPEDETKDRYQKEYLKKLEYRCQNELSHTLASCMDTFKNAYAKCSTGVPQYAAWTLCWPLEIIHICNIIHLIGRPDVCDSRSQVDPGLGEGYTALLNVKNLFSKGIDEVKLREIITKQQDLTDLQEAKETSARIIHAFDEKMTTMRMVITIVNVVAALLFLRILTSAIKYHDKYLINIDFNNVYITGYFKRIDRRRADRGDQTLLPLKKMERSKYIDIHSYSCIATEHNKLLTQILKVMLEMVTATTFVMLDRLFYEALDVVRNAALAAPAQSIKDLEIEVEGTGALARIVRKILQGLNVKPRVYCTYTNEHCLPSPKLMPVIFFLKIYGSYLWIVLLLYLNPYTLRLRRLICSSFYPRREKHRILHLYNDILKRRVKMQHTLRKRAVQGARAHYLSGENLLSLRMKFPHLLGWLKLFPAARATCLICGETEPRHAYDRPPSTAWHSCLISKCPFVYCAECWLEAGARCAVCEPQDARDPGDSLSDEEQLRY